jgi:hypothetical protein
MIELALMTLKEFAGVFPKVTAVAPTRSVPLIVTTVPPDVGPLVGAIDVTSGGRTCAKALVQNRTIVAASASWPVISLKIFQPCLSISPIVCRRDATLSKRGCCGDYDQNAIDYSLEIGAKADAP